MTSDATSVNVDAYLDATYGPQTDECSTTNLMRGMDFVSYVTSKFDYAAMCQLFEVSNGIYWCERKWVHWVATNRSIWWLWSALDKNSKESLCNWYLRARRELLS